MLMRRALATLGVALLAGGAPASALAASTTSTASSATPQIPGTTSPFSPGVPVAPATVPTTTNPVVTGTTTGSGDSGLTGSGAILVAGGAVVILAGISYFIWRDARRHAPVKAASAGSAGSGSESDARRGSKPPVKSRKLSPAERKRRKRGRAR
jgi:hypothetical protein